MWVHEGTKRQTVSAEGRHPTSVLHVGACAIRLSVFRTPGQADVAARGIGPPWRNRLFRGLSSAEEVISGTVCPSPDPVPVSVVFLLRKPVLRADTRSARRLIQANGSFGPTCGRHAKAQSIACCTVKCVEGYATHLPCRAIETLSEQDCLGLETPIRQESNSILNHPTPAHKVMSHGWVSGRARQQKLHSGAFVATDSLHHFQKSLGKCTLSRHDGSRKYMRTSLLILHGLYLHKTHCLIIDLYP